MTQQQPTPKQPAMAQPGPSLRVLTGLHAGAACLLPDGPFSIGSEPPASIVLGDEHVAPRHLVIERDGSGLRLSVEADGVTVEGTEFSRGDIVAAVLPITVGIGGVEFRCEAEGGPVRPARLAAWRLGRSRLSVVGAGAALGAAVLFGLAMVPATTDASALPGAKSPDPAQQKQTRQAGAAPVSDAILRSETQGQLQAAGLPDVSLDVSNGVVMVQGQLDPASVSRLHSVELWFDHRFGEAAVLVSQVSAHAAPKLAIPLDAVWSGPDPNVVIHGQRYYVGASLPGGASIEQITDHQVRVSQGGQHYAVDY